MKNSKFSQRLNDFPPCFCRLLARKKSGPPLTADGNSREKRPDTRRHQLANAAQVEAISKQVKWDGIHILDALAFMYGCRVDLTDAKEVRRIKDYLSKKPMFVYLRRSPVWKTYWLPLMIYWRKSCGEVKPDSNISPPVRKLLKRLDPLLKPSIPSPQNRR